MTSMTKTTSMNKTKNILKGAGAAGVAGAAVSLLPKKLLIGGSKRGKDINLLTPEQQRVYSQLVTQLGPQTIEGLSQFIQPRSPEDIQDVFQKTYVEPATKAYRENVLPQIQDYYGDLGLSSSSSLNQALSQSAQDLSSSLGSQYGGFFERQQQLGLNQDTQRLAALQSILTSLTQKTFTPQFQQQEGILGPLISALGLGAGSYLASSEKVKENIEPYDNGLDLVNKMNVKKYDYKKEFSSQKGKVGLIAESLPQELRSQINGIEHVDVYGLVGVLINAIKELNDKIVRLEAK